MRAKADNKKSGSSSVNNKTNKDRHASDKDKDWYISSTGIRISRKNRDRLKNIGKFGEDYDDVIKRLLDDYEGIT